MTTTKTATLASALADAFAEFESATKDASNPHFRSKYADLPSVVAAIKPALINHRLFFTQATHDAEAGVCVETTVHHESGEHMSFGKLFVPANKRDAHGYGSALTYARRYSLMTAFGIPAEDDDGNAAAKSVANDTQNGKDAPFPQGPAKNKTELKTMARQFWREVEGCGDPDELDALIKDKENVRLVTQLVKALPAWWEGGTREGEEFEGLEQVISKRQSDLAVGALNVG